MAEWWRGIGIAGRGTLVAALIVLAGTLAVFVPYLLRKRAISGGVPAAPALFVATEYALAPGRSACMGSVAVEAGSDLARFAARPASAPVAGGATMPGVGKRSSAGARPAVELVISAADYRTSALAPAGSGYKLLSVPIVQPKHALLANACFTDRGATGVALEGSSEARTVSRSPTTLAGVSVVGGVALAFQRRPRHSLLSALGILFEHASRLTEGLLPVWLLWAFAVLVGLGLPLCSLAALHSALRADA